MSQQRKVVKLSKMKTPRIRCPNNRENCTIIECIWATGQALPCTVILKGKLICTNFVSNLPDDYTLGVSDSGWTNDEIGLYWLEKVFHLETRNIKGKYRLLLMDGHSSYINVDFIAFCEEY